MEQQTTGQMHDQLSIATPELVALEFPLAGLGSRALALCTDYLLQAAAVLVLIFVLVLFAPSLGRHTPGTQKWAIALFILMPFLLQWGYFTLFEAFWSGQTPGKRVLHLQVIQQTGRPIGFVESLGRNLLRVVDFLPGFYVVGAICVFTTRRGQRLGDLVAGTLVIHIRRLETPWVAGGARLITASALEPLPAPEPARSTGLPADVLRRLGAPELEAIESFLARRLDLPMKTADALAARLAQQLSAKLQTPLPSEMSPATFSKRWRRRCAPAVCGADRASSICARVTYR